MDDHWQSPAGAGCRTAYGGQWRQAKRWRESAIQYNVISTGQQRYAHRNHNKNMIGLESVTASEEVIEDSHTSGITLAVMTHGMQRRAIIEKFKFPEQRSNRESFSSFFPDLFSKTKQFQIQISFLIANANRRANMATESIRLSHST